MQIPTNSDDESPENDEKASDTSFISLMHMDLGGSGGKPGGTPLDVVNIPADFSAGETPKLALDITSLPDPVETGPKQRFIPLEDGGYRVQYPDIELDDLTPEFRQLVGDNLMKAKQMLFWAPERIQGNLEQAAFRNLDTARRNSEQLSPSTEDFRAMSREAGMTEAELRFWQNRDPNRIANQITDRELVRLVGTGGYVVQRMQTPEGASLFRENATALAEAEAMMIETWGGMLDRVWYDTRVGFGQAGSFSLKAIAGGARALADINNYFVEDQRTAAVSMGKEPSIITGYEGAEQWAEEWHEYALDKQAQWLGPAIDTGNPITDWLRTSVFQGSPFLAGSVSLAALVGPAGAAGVIASGMGLETYGSLRAEGIDPLTAAGYSGVVTMTSYVVNRFQYEHVLGSLYGRGPIRRFGVGAIGDFAQEFASESIESFGQGAAEATALLRNAPGYTRDDWARDLRESALGSLQEGSAAGVLSLATRLIGFPRALRNQGRSYQFDRTFKDMGAKAAETTLYKEQPQVLAQEINNMAKHHALRNGPAGVVFSSAMELEQGGLTRQEVCDGFGISRDEFDFAKANNTDIVIPIGNAVVFAQQQADAGNTYFQNVLRADPDAMTGREIAEQSREVAATLDVAEQKFKAMATDAETTMPLRLRTFRAGLRAYGFSPNEADACTSVFWARGERAADLWGISLDEWLDQKNVRLEMQTIVKNNREMARYQRLLEQVDVRNTAIDVFAERDAAQGEVAAVDENTPTVENSSTVEALQQVEQSEVAAPVDDAVQIRPNIVQPVETAADNTAWEESVADTIADGLGVEGEQRAAVVEQTRGLIAAGLEIPEVREIAAQIGIVPPGADAADQQQPATAGQRTKVIFPKESGMPAIPAQYALVELDSLQPSHMFRNFTPNSTWSPAELAQQRNYDSGAMEAVRQAIELDRLDFDAVFNPTTDAINGPPIITEDGKILGGNNRSHRIYNRYGQDRYQDTLVAFLDSEENLTGITPAAALDMKQPVLVRVAQDVAVEDVPGLIGALNADFTNRRDPANLAANRGARVGDRTLAAFAGINDQSVAAYLDSPATARRVLQAMVEDGALQNTDLPALYNFANDRWLGDGRNSGKAQVEQALFGAILPDSRLLDDLSDSMKRKLVRALPGLIRLRRNNSPELATLFEAVSLHNDFQAFKDSPEAKGLKPAAKLELFRQPNQADLFTGEVAPEKSGPAWDMFLELNAMKTQREVADFFTRKADELSGVGRGLFGGLQLYQDGITNGEQLDAAMRQRDRVREMMAQARKNPGENKAFLGLRAVTDREAGIIQDEAGIDVSGYTHVLDISALRHIWNRHGMGNENNPANIPLTADDIANIPILLVNPDSISYSGKTDLGLDGIQYEIGRPSDGTVYIIEAVRTGRKKLAVTSMWIKKGNAGDPQHTSEASPVPKTGAYDAAGLRTDTLPNENGNVNSDGEIIEELYQPAYHGSPHRFDKFSLNAIGTGEGAQAYGWGLYFAGNRKVADYYRKAVKGSEPKKIPLEVMKALHKIDYLGFDYAGEALAAIRSEISSGSNWHDIFDVADFPKETALIDDYIKTSSNQLYKVEVPEDDILLDWDKTLYDQSKKVLELLGDNVLSLEEQRGTPNSKHPDLENWGSSIYGYFVEKLGSDEAASKYLNSLGIKGIRYLDGISRRAGEGNHNYVIFDENAIEILETYYQEKSGNKRGAIRFQSAANAPTIIKLLQGADVSTVIHELNHLFVFDLQQMVAAGKGGERARTDLAALTDFAGGKLDRAGYERIAQAWERYAMDGTAPSPDLYDAFDTFRKYMSRIYQNATQQLGVEPSANVRAVFDRFLATDAEIADAKHLYQQSERWWEKMQNMDAAAKHRLRVLDERMQRAERRRRDTQGGGKALGRLAGLDLNKTRERVRGREANTPAYRAISAVKEGGGFNRAEVEQLVGKPAAEEMARRHGADIFGGDVDVDVLAGESGFTSAIDMLSAISGVESLDTAVDANVRADLDAEDRAARENRENRGEEVFDDRVDEEEEFLREQAEAAVKLNGGGARALRDWRIKYKSLKIAVERQIGGMDMHHAMDMRRFEKGKRDAQRAADKAALKGDTKALAEYRDQVLLHHLLIRESQKARAMNDRVQDEYGTRALLKKLQADQYHPRVEDAFAEAVKDLATFMGFTNNRRTRPAAESDTLVMPAPEPGSSVSDFLPDLAASLDPWMRNKVRPDGFMTYRDFTFDQIKEADRVLRLLVNQGRGELQAMRDLGVSTMEELVGKSLEHMDRRDSRPKQNDDRTLKKSIRNAVEGFFVHVTTPETWFMMMDGNPTIQGKEAGINQRMFWALRDCQLAKDKLYKSLMERMQPHFATIEQAKADIEKQFGGKYFLVPGVDVPDILKTGRDYKTWDADMLISMALNMGNDANLYALQQGYGLTDAQLKTIGRLFSTEQWQAIQGVWDAIDSLYPQLDAVTFRITNRHVPKELAQAFTVEARGGELVQMKGGYFPLLYDPMLSERAGQFTDLENALYKGQMEAIHASTKPADGMLKERNRDDEGNPVVGRPQLLRTSLIIQHMDASLHYITHAERILEFDRLTRNEEWKREFVDKFGDRRYRAMRNWVQDLARPKRLNNDPVSRIMNKARDLATINALGLRGGTGLKQRQGLFNAASFMQDASRTGAWGWGYVLKGMQEIGFGGNFGAKTAKMMEIDALSDYMAARDGGHDREIRAMVEKLSPIDAHFTIPGTSIKVEKKRFHDFMFAWIQANDRAASYAVWAGAYLQAESGNANFDIKGMTDEQRRAEAIKFADAAAATQASSFAADLTAMQRTDGIGRFLGMFMSGNVRQGSRLLQYLDAMKLGDKTKGDVALLACREFVFPALAWVFMASAIKMGLGDDEDDIFTEMVWEAAETAIAPFPLLREIPSTLRYGPANIAAVEMPTRAIGQVFGAPGKIADGKAGRAMFDLVSGLGFFTGVPLSNIAREARPVTDALGVTERR